MAAEEHLHQICRVFIPDEGRLFWRQTGFPFVPRPLERSGEDHSKTVRFPNPSVAENIAFATPRTNASSLGGPQSDEQAGAGLVMERPQDSLLRGRL